MDEPPELDPQWVAEKEAKQAAYAAEQDRKPPSKLTAWLILGGVMVAGLVVIGFLIMQRQPNAKGEALEGVELTVTSKLPGVPFTVDGAKAGKTPQSLKIKSSRTKPIVIKGNGVVKTVTPDHDQVITLDP
jgi:hypothetical protein